MNPFGGCPVVVVAADLRLATRVQLAAFLLQTVVPECGHIHQNLAQLTEIQGRRVGLGQRSQAHQPLLGLVFPSLVTIVVREHVRMEDRCQPENQRRRFGEFGAELHQNDMPVDGHRIVAGHRTRPETLLDEFKLVLGGQQSGIGPHLESGMRPRVGDKLVADPVQRLLPVLRVERPGLGLHPDPHPGSVV